MDTMQVGSYTVTFDEQGATIMHQRTGARYRITAETATNAVDFMQQHKSVCFAMMNNHPEDLLPYQQHESA